MLERVTNEQLFDEICNQLNLDSSINVLSYTLLAKIKRLRIVNGVDSLRGIEKLVNLEYLEIVGQEDSTNIF